MQLCLSSFVIFARHENMFMRAEASIAQASQDPEAGATEMDGAALEGDRTAGQHVTSASEADIDAKDATLRAVDAEENAAEEITPTGEGGGSLDVDFGDSLSLWEAQSAKLLPGTQELALVVSAGLLTCKLKRSLYPCIFPLSNFAHTLWAEKASECTSLSSSNCTKAVIPVLAAMRMHWLAPRAVADNPTQGLQPCIQAVTP